MRPALFPRAVMLRPDRRIPGAAHGAGPRMGPPVKPVGDGRWLGGAGSGEAGVSGACISAKRKAPFPAALPAAAAGAF